MRNLQMKKLTLCFCLIIELCSCGSFWHLTDTHSDELYQPGTAPNQQARCISGVGDAGFYGSFKCYIPLLMQEESLKQMKAIDANPDFILLGGDTVPGDPDDHNLTLQSIYNTTQTAKKYFPNTPIIYALGNHDCYPAYLVQPNSQWLTDVADLLTDFLDDTQLATFKKGAYYSKIIGQLKIIIVNTAFYWGNNNFTGDVGDQFQFLKDELNSAEQNNLKVLIHGHIPPGYFERTNSSIFNSDTYNNEYIQALEGYHGIVVGQIYGHVHTDIFHLTKDNGAMFVQGALTANNPPVYPGMRRYIFDNSTYTLQYYQQYYTNLSADNANLNLTWNLLYQTNEKPYEINDLSLPSMRDFERRMEENDDIFQAYYSFNTVGYPQPSCNSYCKKLRLCSIKYITKIEYELCMNSGEQEEQEVLRKQIKQIRER